MLIGAETRRIMNNNHISVSNNNDYSSDSTYKPVYFTRLQTKLHKNGTINIYPHTTIANIKSLVKKIEKCIPGIQYFIDTSIINNDVTLTFNNNFFQLNGKNIDLYSFLTNRITLQLLSSLWVDNTNNENKNTTYQLNEIQYKKYVKNIITNNTHTKNKCPICIENFKINQLISKTKCNHYFHKKCLYQWLTQDCSKPNCPCCRNDIIY